MYICERSRSFGAGSATTRKTRGLTLSVSRLITPPFPAVSRPSNTMHTLACSSTIQRCICTSSTCRRRSSSSYSLRRSLATCSPLSRITPATSWEHANRNRIRSGTRRIGVAPGQQLSQFPQDEEADGGNQRPAELAHIEVCRVEQAAQGIHLRDQDGQDDLGD